MPAFEVYLKDRLFWRYSFSQDEIRIGRSKDNDIVLPDPAVSRVHSIVSRDEDKHLIIDKSTNGTFVNQKKIRRVALSHRDRISIADYSLIFIKESPAEESFKTGRRDDNATIVRSYNEKTGSLTIEAFYLSYSRNDETEKFPIEKALARIGSAKDNDVRIQQPSVDKHHAFIECREDGFFLKDLNSREGTYVQGNRVSEAAIKAGFEITFGKVKTRFLSATKGSPLSPTQATSFSGILGQSPAMQKLYSLVRKISASSVAILLQGETGTGKELVARAIHSLSDRAESPLITLNCGAIPKTLIESEFFGHKKGAFTGSEEERIGAFERANTGTIFLDEIGELPLDLQPKLLRVIEEKSVTRVGANTSNPTDFRLIAATNRTLDEEVTKGNFRQDLYFRISIVPVTLPPLRERKEDIPVLVEHFLKLKETESGTSPPSYRITNPARKKLMLHNWPGNVRELKNVIERAVLMTEKDEIDAEDLSFIPLGKDEVEESIFKGDQSLEDIEKKVILETLRANNGDKKTTAEVLGVAYSTLWAKMKKYDITI